MPCKEAVTLIGGGCITGSKYLDSKFQAGSSLSDYATFRTYTPADWKGVAPNADITIKSFAAMYGTIKWVFCNEVGTHGEGETKTIKAPDMHHHFAKPSFMIISSLNNSIIRVGRRVTHAEPDGAGYRQ